MIYLATDAKIKAFTRSIPFMLISILARQLMFGDANASKAPLSTFVVRFPLKRTLSKRMATCNKKNKRKNIKKGKYSTFWVH